MTTLHPAHRSTLAVYRNELDGLTDRLGTLDDRLHDLAHALGPSDEGMTVSLVASRAMQAWAEAMHAAAMLRRLLDDDAATTCPWATALPAPVPTPRDVAERTGRV